MLEISDVEKIAKLARFDLTQEEKEKFQRLLTEALDYLEVIETLDTSNVSPTASVSGLKNYMREDTAWESLSSKEAISNAPSTKDGFVVTSAVIKKHE